MSRTRFEKLRPETPYPEGKKGEKPELTPDEMREKLRDPSFLPSYEELSRHFEKFGGLGHLDDEWEKWYDLCRDKKKPIFEIWTKEYIHAFGNYLAKRVAELGGTEENPTVILEVGAGNGCLTHFLQEKMNELIPSSVKVVASDSGDWKIPQAFLVENLPHNKALAKYKPKIVIFSWLPYQYDCTADFRAVESVDEYILIGETDGGCCGNEWLTWGQNWAFDEEKRKQRENQAVPYEADGFEKVYKNDLSDLQLSRTNIFDGRGTTSTVSFKKKK